MKYHLFDVSDPDGEGFIVNHAAPSVVAGDIISLSDSEGAGPIVFEVERSEDIIVDGEHVETKVWIRQPGVMGAMRSGAKRIYE